MITNLKTATNAEALAEWDSGGSVWSCEMGGMGPGYEQCIQVMAFEMLRAIVANPPANWKDFQDEQDKWRAYRDQIEALPSVKGVIEKLRPSGAQFGAAMSMACMFARNGYAEAMATVPDDRRIQVSKNFPTLQ